MKKFWLVLAVLSLVACAKKHVTVIEKGSELHRIYFDFDKSNIKPEFEDALKANAKAILVSPKPVTIEGHADERGTDAYNVILGENRAQSAKTFLKNLGVQESNMSTISYGRSRPVCLEKNESCYSTNRRAEFIAK